jgi:cytochrome c
LASVAIGSAVTGSYVAAAQEKTVWDGVFTAAQATRGEGVYFEECASCHGRDLVGGDGSPAPPLAGDMFLDGLADSSVADFVERVRTTMPLDSPARLSRTQYVEIVAFILKANRVPAGADELGTDLEAFGRIAITKRPAGK